MTTHVFDPNKGRQIGPAWRAVVANLKEREWGAENVIISIAKRHGDIKYGTAKRLIHDAVKHGYLQRRPLVGSDGNTYWQVKLIREMP